MTAAPAANATAAACVQKASRRLVWTIQPLIFDFFKKGVE
jgi:hypothetical protein